MKLTIVLVIAQVILASHTAYSFKASNRSIAISAEFYKAVGKKTFICPFSAKLTCNATHPYRSFDGTCNNVVTNSYFGSSNTPFSRILPQQYDAGSDKRTVNSLTKVR